MSMLSLISSGSCIELKKCNPTTTAEFEMNKIKNIKTHKQPLETAMFIIHYNSKVLYLII